MGKIIKIAVVASRSEETVRSEMSAYLALSAVKAFDRRIC
jgi:hypothetical protein